MLLTIRRVKLIGMKKFAITILNSDHKPFVVYIAAINTSFNIGDKIHLLTKAQIAYLKVDEALIKIFSKYADFANIFLPKLVRELPKYISINDYIIELVDD